MTRREQREQTFILIFEKIFHEDASFSELTEAAAFAQSHKPDAYALSAAEGVYSHLEELDAVISQNARGWKLERLSKIALSILRLAIYEIKFCDDIPESVSINEAVELAKTYSTTEDASFINGLLGTVARAAGEQS
ncbi:MAG: transcription antitermination factor NusB [Oscillospiraceae bacterium]|jgi:N utilization substance protein B|nr:transcription antitermination factor NusB [Oscillospiraceae bacterium]